MSKGRCFNCFVGLPIGKPLEELIESKFPVFCCTDCSELFNERIEDMKKFIDR